MQIFLPPTPPEGTIWRLQDDGSWLLVTEQEWIEPQECVWCSDSFISEGQTPDDEYCPTCRSLLA
jgi:hypothetical protein